MNIEAFKSEIELTQADEKIILQSLKFQFYDKDEIVFKKGDQGDEFFIILQGEVSV
jgi:CRP-like cAMP-binding protein